jgi:hypothetical protein
MTEDDVITESELEALRAELSSNERESWRTIPWQVSIAHALSLACRENKLLLMIVRSGHPLGCTCNNGLVDRAMVDLDPEVASLLQTRFIPVAVDQHIHRRRDDQEGRIFSGIVKQAGSLVELSAQGFYIFTSSTRLLSFCHTQDVTVVKRLLNDALSSTGSDPVSSAPVLSDPGPDSVLNPPREVVVLDVLSKVLGGYHAPGDSREAILQSAQGRDHCWIRRDEVLELAAGIMPDSLLSRMARFHLVDNTRGEPPMWDAEDIRSVSADLHEHRFTGSISIEAESSLRGYAAHLLGSIRAEGETLKQFDIIARGMAWGSGPFNGGAPRGKYPFAVRFTIAQGVWPFDSIPPGAARTRAAEYLGYPVAVGL